MITSGQYSFVEIKEIIEGYIKDGYEIKFTGQPENQIELSLRFIEDQKIVEINLSEAAWEALVS